MKWVARKNRSAVLMIFWIHFSIIRISYTPPPRIKGRAIFWSRPSTTSFCRPSSFFFQELPNVFPKKHQKIVARPRLARPAPKLVARPFIRRGCNSGAVPYIRLMSPKPTQPKRNTE